MLVFSKSINVCNSYFLQKSIDEFFDKEITIIYINIQD